MESDTRISRMYLRTILNMSPEAFIELINRGSKGRQRFEFFFPDSNGDLSVAFRGCSITDNNIVLSPVYFIDIIDNKCHGYNHKIAALTYKRYPVTEQGFEAFKDEALLELL